MIECIAIKIQPNGIIHKDVSFTHSRKLARRRRSSSVGMAAALETEIEWLRPLVSNDQPWEYCVIWKLGDDPSRFIEWGACCCSGGRRGGVKGEDLIDECRDELIKHSVSSYACRKLAHSPSVIPLYSGIHGDVVISKRPRSTTQSNADEDNGTQVLIPIKWGLIELYTTQHIPRDQTIINYVCAQFSSPLKQENMIDSNNQENSPPSLHFPNLAHKISQSTNYSSFDGSSTCSSLSNEPQLIQLGHELSGVSLDKPSKDHVRLSSRNPRPRRKRYTGGSTLTDCTEIVGMEKRGPFKSKNLVTERNRRKRIKDRELALRALVPNITKMDRIATLTDAADYIKEMVQTIRSYHDEIEELEEEDCNEVKATDENPVLVGDCGDKEGGNEKTQIVVGVEVFQVGKKDFLVKIISKQERGSFSKLMEAFDCLGLKVADANVTTLHGLVSNVLTVEAYGEDFDPNALKQSLVQLVN